MCSVREGRLCLGAAQWGVFALGLDRVRDPREQRGVVCEGCDMAPVNVLGAGEEMVVAGGADVIEGSVDLRLAR